MPLFWDNDLATRARNDEPDHAAVLTKSTYHAQSSCSKLYQSVMFYSRAGPEARGEQEVV